jgi:PelA/Pel-15E family pectate lyase
MDSIRRLPTYRAAADTTTLLSDARLSNKPEWKKYIARSRAMYDRDTASMNAELRALGRKSMTRGPYTHDFSVKPVMTDKWFATDSANRMAESILSFQAPNGGWSKHVDFTAHSRQPGESYYAESADWEWISTVDNNSTTEEIEFLKRANKAHRDVRYDRAIARGVAYLLESQMPNGCIPQVYPLEGSYHDAATFNDDATVNVLRLYREASAGAAFEKGIGCILDTQVRHGDTLLAWGQQHDPITLQPVSARSYELASLSALESGNVVELLMSIESPSPRVVKAVWGATDWLRRSAIKDLIYEKYQLRAQPGAGPLWGRLYELGTNRVIMANRDGIKLYDWNKLTDRRSGYGWYTTAPAATLAEFARWSKRHPRPS